MKQPMPGSTLHRMLMLVAFCAATVLAAWSVEHAPMKAYGAIERQDTAF